MGLSMKIGDLDSISSKDSQQSNNRPDDYHEDYYHG
jgi:thiamine pyrophosphokinase